MLRLLQAVGLAALALAAGWFLHGWLRPGAGRPESQHSVGRVMRGRLEQTAKARGIVKPAPNALVRIGLPFPKDVSRRISKLAVVEGDMVDPGAVLVELDHDDLKASQAQLTAELSVFERRLEALKVLEPVEARLADAVVAERKAQREHCQRLFDRAAKLRSTQLGTEQAYEIAQSDLAQAAAKLAQAETSLDQVKARYRTDIAVLEAQIQQAKATIETVAVQIRWSTLRSPLPGPAQVFAVHQRKGELTSGQPNVPVMTLLDPSQLQVHLYVDETDFGRIRVGQPATFRLESHPDQGLGGRIVRVLPQPILQENVVYYLAVVEVPADQRSLLRPEMTVLAHVQAGVNENALWLPLAAVRSRPDGWYVLRSGPQGPVEVPVRIGWKDQGRVEIREGLAEGDEVLLDP
jgi:HlyD family secretion protein/macrolide-specific efflux system membrane fusion protein